MEFLQLPITRPIRRSGLEFYGRVSYLKAGIVYADLHQYGQSTLQRGDPDRRIRPRAGWNLALPRAPMSTGIVNGIDDQRSGTRRPTIG